MICQIKGCNNGALISYGSKWICGKCMVKVLNNQKDKQNKELKELEEVN